MNFFLLAIAALPAVLASPASPPNPGYYGSTGPYGSSGQGAGTPSNSNSNWGLTNGPIYPNYNSGKCLDVKGNVQADGTPVQIYDCNGSGAQEWTMLGSGRSGPTKVQLTGTNYCLDVGLSPYDGTPMKIWTCINDGSAPQQDFVYKSNDQIAHDNFCLDLKDGVLDDGNTVQIYGCGDGNLNQVWTRRG